MTITAITAATLPTFSFDQLGRAWGQANDAARAARYGTGWYGRCLNIRAMVGDEVSRRGAVIRPLFDGTFGCGYPSDFEPISMAVS